MRVNQRHLQQVVLRSGWVVDRKDSGEEAPRATGGSVGWIAGASRVENGAPGDPRKILDSQDNDESVVQRPLLVNYYFDSLLR